MAKNIKKCAELRISSRPNGPEIEFKYEIKKRKYKKKILTPGFIEIKQSIDRKTVDKLTSQFEDLSKSKEKEKLKEYGQFLFTRFFHNEVKTFLKKLNRPLFIITTTDESELPWELAHDGDNFLGIKHEIGRQLGVKSFPTFKNLSSSKKLSFLFIVNPTNDLQCSEDEITELITSIRKNVEGEIKVLAKDEANHLNIGIELSKGIYDVIHYSGHIKADKRKNKGFMLLADGGQLSCEDASFLEKDVSNPRHPVVFLNGCKSNSMAESITAGFIQGGARAVIADSYNIRDKSAKMFAIAFYQELFKRDCSIGNAIKNARKKCDDNKTADNSWGSYVLYGDPTYQLIGGNIKTVQSSSTEIFVDNNLNKERFSPLAWQIMEWSLDEAKNTGWSQLKTSHLFMALIRVKDGCTRSVLADNYIDSRVLRELFREIIAQTDSDAEITLEKKFFCENLQETLNIANEKCKNNNDSVIGENHLLKALLLEQKGDVANILDAFNFSLEKIKEDIESYGIEGTKIESSISTSSYEELFLSDGHLDKSQFSKKSIIILQDAMLESYATGWEEIRSPHLFLSLINVKNSCANTIIANSSEINPSEIYRHLKKAIKIGPSIHKEKSILEKNTLSENTVKILITAKTKAKTMKSNLIDESHLFLAYLYYKEGIIYEIIENIGLNIEILRMLTEKFLQEKDTKKERTDRNHFSQSKPIPNKNLFLKDGYINRSRFSTLSLQTLENSFQEAVNTGWTKIRTPHIFMGLLLIENSLACRILTEKVINAYKILPYFRQLFTQGPPLIKIGLEIKKQLFSANALIVLEKADAYTMKRKSLVIEESDILNALLQDERDITGQILKEMGLDIQELQKSLIIH